MLELPIEQLQRNPEQPRKKFDPVELQKLAASIEATGGVIQPIVVVERNDGWQIVAGERRWRACQLIKRATVLCRILDSLDERELAQYALLENLDRVELSPTEIGYAYAKLEQKHGMSQTEIAHWVGRDRTEVNRYISLTKLPEAVQKSIDQGELSVGHAKVLLGAPEEERRSLARQCIKKSWSVRRLEQEVGARKDRPAHPGKPETVEALANALGERLAASCSIRKGKGGKWTLTVESYSPDSVVDALHRLADEIEAKSGGVGRVDIELTGPVEVFDFLGE